MAFCILWLCLHLLRVLVFVHSVKNIHSTMLTLEKNSALDQVPLLYSLKGATLSQELAQATITCVYGSLMNVHLPWSW